MTACPILDAERASAAREVRRRRLILGAGLMPFAGRAAHASTFPQRPLRVIVPFPRGGGVDAFARAFVPALSAALGESVVIENVGGAAEVVPLSWTEG